MTHSPGNDVAACRDGKYDCSILSITCQLFLAGPLFSHE